MPELSAQVDIPNRALFKASEVCEILSVQPYVLRSWETEFPGLGVTKTAGGPRVYRRADVEQVAKIKHLLLVDGLTLAGARRKLEEETAPVVADEPAMEELVGRNARERLTAVKRGLRSILDLLARANVDEGGRGVVAPSRPRVRSAGANRTKASRSRGSASRNGSRARARGSHRR